MTNLLESLAHLGVKISRVVEQPVCDNKGLIVAWNYFIQDANGLSVSGGTHEDKSIAKRIAVAEALERSLAKKVFSNDSSRTDFLMDDFPTSCGFACGFENTPTKMRAIREAVERWAWSMWIDRHYFLDSVSVEKFPKSSLSNFICSQFQNVRLFYCDSIPIAISETPTNFSFLVALLETEDGVFAGCRAGTNHQDILSHALVEAYRNYQNYILFKSDSNKTTNSIVAKRSIYFASRKNEALEQIHRAILKPWPEGKIQLLKEYPTGISDIYLWRCILKDYVGWHLGDENRFVY